ncbi:hypothetical protein [Nocardia sp. 2TAF39]|uniref:hypothetical protein n=1 Tax=unclassified Nocardia TaxID=2637762 RepID=UPI003F9AE581
MNALNLPSSPAALLGEHAAAVDTAYRHVAARLDGDGPASVDEDGNGRGKIGADRGRQW